MDTEEYGRMAESGIFAPEERVELLEGEILRVPAQNFRHAAIITQANRLLISSFPEPWEVRCKVPLDLGLYSQPEPDFAIVAPRPDFAQAHPTSAVLVIEIADTSLRDDRVRKGRVYARAGIAEYWLANLQDQVLEVLRQPTRTGSYRQRLAFTPGQKVACLAVPDSPLEVSKFLLPS